MSITALLTLPNTWEALRLKWLLQSLESGRREISDTDNFEGGVLSIGGEHIGWQGEWLLDKPRYISREFFENMSSGKIQMDDILLVKDGATIGKVAIASTLPADEAAVNEHVFLLRIHPNNVPKYYFYFVQSSLAQDQIQLEIRGSAQPGLNSEFCNVLVAPRPPKDIQKSIADYLDSETARTDTLIATKERLLELLTEKRQALITHAVTKGLDPKMKMKDSGVEWIGKVPEHWGILPGKRLFFERDQRSLTGDEDLLTVSHITGVTPRSEKNVNMFEAETTEGYKICHKGDLIINTLWAWMGAMGTSHLAGIVSPAYNVYTPTELFEPEFVDLLVRLRLFAQEVTRFSKGVWSSRLRLYPEAFFKVRFPVPPLQEQRSIVTELQAKIYRIDVLVKKTQHSIELLKEHRSALITAVVTGQIDVEVIA